MKITWTLKKDRGYNTLTCRYTIERTPEEIKLSVQRLIDKLTTQDFNPEAEKHTHIHTFEMSSYREVDSDNAFNVPPEFLPVAEKVIRSFFEKVMAGYDKNFKAAFECEPVDLKFELDHSKLVKRTIAPLVAARKMKPADIDDIF
jgi:hypothetical protein